VQVEKFKNLLKKALSQEFLENDSRSKIMEPIKVGILVAHGDST